MLGQGAPDPGDSLRLPRSTWNRLATLLVLGLVVSPLVFALVLEPELRTSRGLATATQFVVYPMVLAATILLYFSFRVTGSTVFAWATLCLAIVAVQGCVLAGLRARRPGSFFERPGWILVVDLAVGLLMLLALWRATRTDLPVDPLGAGLVAGLLVAGTNVSLNHYAPELPMTSPLVVVVEIDLVLVGLAIGRTIYHWEGFPRWFLFRGGLGALALVVNRLAICQDDHVVYHSIAVVSGVTGAVLMTTAAAANLHKDLVEQRESLIALSDQVATMEADERDHRARLHEITNSISSIAVASSLLHQVDEVSPGKREQLEHMLEAEASRLARILSNAGGALDGPDSDDPDAPERRREELDLDAVIEPVVVSHQALGRKVEWQPSGCRAVGDPDAVAEAINILLDNVARHAPEASAWVEVKHLGTTVEIAVRDDGPGVPEEVRRRLFEWGGRGPDSKGQGIGLHLAHKLMTEGGNSLRLESDRAGTSFVIGLPAAEEAP